ncbi:MAG: hypothetical protein NC548_13270 [Lachnospiraceae bacterium]|nr:hypothetical protein [Lachnospiraceae bacterium]MCM1230639.1 hypothetical protein [Ruminococcus flavefaciens]
MYNNHYISIDEKNRVVDGWSDGPLPEKDILSNDICINSKGSYQFCLIPDGEENPLLFTEDMIPLYKWDGETVISRTAEEIKADRDEQNSNKPDPIPTEQEKLRADLDYVMLMMGLEVDPE